MSNKVFASPPQSERKGFAKIVKRLKVERFSLLLAIVQLDNSPLEANGYGVGSVVGTELG